MIPGTREGANGTEKLYYRDCDNGTSGPIYVPPVDIADLRTAARNTVTKQLPLPALDVSPSGSGIVRVQNWLAVAPEADVTATAAVGPIWITMTATQQSLHWKMGDGGEVNCDSPTGTPLPAGVTNLAADDINGAADCGYTFEHISSPEFGANNALAYENTVTSSWAITWIDYTGTTGTENNLDRTSNWNFQVRQIQTQRTTGND